MVDELTRKQSKVPLDTKSKHNFSVASGPDFETLGMAAQPITYMTKSTDDEEMNFHVAGCHVADLGGSAGEGSAKNLLDIIKSMNTVSYTHLTLPTIYSV